MVTSVNNYPEAVIKAMETNLSSQNNSQMNNVHEHRKEENDKIQQDSQSG